MGNLKSRWSLLKKRQAKLGNVNRWSDCRLAQVGGIQVHVDGRKSALGPVWETVSAFLEPDFSIQVTESIALNRNQTRWFIPINLAPSLGVRIQNLGRAIAPAAAGEQYWRKAGSGSSKSSLQQNRASVEAWEKSVASWSLLLTPQHTASLDHHAIATQAMQAVWRNSRCTDSRSETLPLMCCFRGHLSPWQKKGGRSALFLALFPSCGWVCERDETLFEPLTYKSNSSGKWPPHGPRLGEWYKYKEKDIVSVNAASGKEQSNSWSRHLQWPSDWRAL